MSDTLDLLRQMDSFWQLLSRLLVDLSTETVTFQARRGKNCDDKFLQLRINVQLDGASLMDCGFTLSYLVKGGVNWDFFSLHCHKCGASPLPDYHRGARFACPNCDTLVPVSVIYAQLQTRRRPITERAELSEIARGILEEGLQLRGWGTLDADIKAHEVWGLCLAAHESATSAYNATILQSIEAR